MRMHCYYSCMRMSSLFLTGQATSNLYEMFSAGQHPTAPLIAERVRRDARTYMIERGNARLVAKPDNVVLLPTCPVTALLRT
jgi:hypothetical protein